MNEIDNILDIMESDAPLSDGQLDMLESDAELRAAAEDIVIAGRVLIPKPSTEEVDSRLEAFKTSHLAAGQEAERQERHKVRLLWLSLTATAAAIAGMVWLLHRPSRQDDPSLLFKADAVVRTCVTDMDGNELPLMAHDEGGVDAVISAHDYAADPALLERDTLILSLSQGQSYCVDLPDGSRVYLHPGSRLLYPTAFGRHSRDVRLEGEGYFIIAKDAARPFNVMTEHSVTSVLGTEFSLSSRREEAESLVLVHGRVSFKDRAGGRPVEVRPGEEVVLDRHGFVDVHPADTMQAVSWRDGFLYYDRSSLQDILKQIGSIYNVSVHCSNRDLLNLHMHFVLRRDQDIEDAVRLLNNMKKVHATLKGNTLTVR